MIEIVLATRNEGKLREFKEILKELNVNVLSLNDFRGFPGIEEDGKTLEDNALKKAKTLFEFTKGTVIADDSGLAVDVLNGAPGVFSARYAGPGASDLDNNRKLLKELEGTPLIYRGASFKCAIAIVAHDGGEHVVTGECRGKIALDMRGSSGFGYDPIFTPDGFDRTFAELGMGVKNKISHRFEAIKAMKEVLKKIFPPE